MAITVGYPLSLNESVGQSGVTKPITEQEYQAGCDRMLVLAQSGHLRGGWQAMILLPARPQQAEPVPEHQISRL